MIVALLLLVLAQPSEDLHLPETLAVGPPVLSFGQPRYPEAARKARLTGHAVIELFVASDGIASLASATGTNPLLVAAAQRTALEFRFSPASHSHRCATLVFHFALQPEASEDPGATLAFVSPHAFLVSAASYPPPPAWECRLPMPEPCFIEYSIGSTTFCEKALRLLPF